MEMPDVSATELIAIVVILTSILQKAGIFKKLERGSNAIDDLKITEIVEEKIHDNITSDANDALMSQKIIKIVDDKIKDHTTNTSDNVLEKVKSNGSKIADHNTSIEKICLEIQKIKGRFDKYDLMVDNNKDNINEIKIKMDKLDNKIDSLIAKMIPHKNVYGDIE